jgi:agmatinase
MNKQEIIDQFDPNSAGLTDANIYGLPFENEMCSIILVPVPWEVTVSYGSGAADGPAHIFEASFQVDLHHEKFPNLWKEGIGMDKIPQELQVLGNEMRPKAERIIAMHEEGIDMAVNAEAAGLLAQVNAACETMNQWVEQRVEYWQNQGKKVALLGGDHSTPLGYYRALAKKHEHFGILHIDAHMDLRIAYEGFQYSHASIMYNTIQLPEVNKLVQVGIRDFCAQEDQVTKDFNNKVKVFSDFHLQSRMIEGETWKSICDHIVDQLPEKILISFDIDGLDPTLCPNTGTPVPGGLSYAQALYLLNTAAEKKQLIGFDLIEVAPGVDDWNGNVGARLLFHLCGLFSQASA